MSLTVIPEYKGGLRKVLFPKHEQEAVESVLAEFRQDLSCSGAELIDVEVHGFGDQGQTSLFLRDPAIFIGTLDERPVVLMSNGSIMHAVGNEKDKLDDMLLRSYLGKQDAEIINVPFFVIGGDCIITDRHAVVGWMTPQVTGWAYHDYRKGMDAVKQSFGNLGIDVLFLDDIGELTETKYHRRRFHGFYHVDTAVMFGESAGKVCAVVALPAGASRLLRDNLDYTTFVTAELDMAGYPVHRASAYSDGDTLWSPTNAIIDGNNRRAFLIGSSDRSLTEEARQLYQSLGYDARITNPVESYLETAKAGARCITFAIK